MFKVFLVKKNKRLYLGNGLMEKRNVEYNFVFEYCELDSVVFLIIFVVFEIMYLLLIKMDNVLVLILLSMLFSFLFNSNINSSVFKFFKVDKEKENLFIKKFKLILMIIESEDRVRKIRDSGIVGCEVFNDKYIDYGGKIVVFEYKK